VVGSAAPFREFAYIDREKLEDFLSAAMGGLPLERKARTTDMPARVDTGVDLKIASAKRVGGRRELSWEEIRQATPASMFEELSCLLADGGGVKNFEGMAADDWERLHDGDFVEGRCEVELSSLESLIDLFARLAKFLPLFADAKAQDDEWQKIVVYLDMLSQERDMYNVRLIPVQAPTPRHQFVAALDKSKTRVNRGALTGRYTVFGRIQNRLAKGATFELFNLLPQGLRLSRDQARDLLSRFKDVPPGFGRPPTMEDLRVSHPAIILTPVAIYR
jgi:hypothetical protein